jgi:hypothetical protein
MRTPSRTPAPERGGLKNSAIARGPAGRDAPHPARQRDRAGPPPRVGVAAGPAPILDRPAVCRPRRSGKGVLLNPSIGQACNGPAGSRKERPGKASSGPGPVAMETVRAAKPVAAAGPTTGPADAPVALAITRPRARAGEIGRPAPRPRPQTWSAPPAPPATSPGTSAQSPRFASRSYGTRRCGP